MNTSPKKPVNLSELRAGIYKNETGAGRRRKEDYLLRYGEIKLTACNNSLQRNQELITEVCTKKEARKRFRPHNYEMALLNL